MPKLSRLSPPGIKPSLAAQIEQRWRSTFSPLIIFVIWTVADRALHFSQSMRDIIKDEVVFGNEVGAAGLNRLST